MDLNRINGESIMETVKNAINENGYINNYVTDKDTYISMKKLQKSIAKELKKPEIMDNYYKSHNDWLSRKPSTPSIISKICDLGHEHNYESPDHINWKKEEPTKISNYCEVYNSKFARHFNIIYSMIKGRSYKQIESKVRSDNDPHIWILDRIIKAYSLDRNVFFDKDGKLK